MNTTRTIEIPVRMLHAVGVAAKENTRFSMDAVLIDVSCEHATIAAVATDGRCMVVAEWGKGLYDADERLVVPGDVARSAAKLATQAAPGDPEPMASLSCSEGRACEVKVLTDDGVAVLSWQETDLPFPPYRDIIPDWSDSTGVATIGITPELLAKALKTIQKIVGEEAAARVYLPARSDKPLGFESSDDTLKVLAIVMPANIGEWLEKPQAVKGEKKAAAAEDDETEPLPFAEKDAAKRAAKATAPLAEMVTSGEYESVTIEGGGEKIVIDRPLAEKIIAAAAPDCPDPAGIDPLTTARVVSFFGDNARFSIDVGRRPNGQWAAQHAAQLGDGRKHTCNSTGYQGRHLTRGEAIAAAADAIDEWAKGLRGTSSSVTAGVKEIRAELDRLDKDHAGEDGSAERQNRVAVAAV